MRRTSGFLFSSLLLLGTLAGCGAEPLVPDGTGGITGQWSFVVDVTVATGVCEGEEDAPNTTSTVTIVQTNDAVSATGPWGSDSGSETLLGSRSGDIVTFTGSYAEDGGTTIATHRLNIAEDELTMDGTEFWSWSGAEGSCPDSQSIVTATRN